MRLTVKIQIFSPSPTETIRRDLLANFRLESRIAQKAIMNNVQFRFFQIENLMRNSNLTVQVKMIIPPELENRKIFHLLHAYLLEGNIAAVSNIDDRFSAHTTDSISFGQMYLSQNKISVEKMFYMKNIV